MKRLISYLFIVISLGLFLNIGSQAKVVSDNVFKFKQMKIPLSQDGEWRIIGSKTQDIYGAKLNFKYLAQQKDNKLSKLIEIVHITTSIESRGASVSWFKDFTFQKNGYKSCIPSSGSTETTKLREKYYVYVISSKSATNCFFTRNMDIENEIINPGPRRYTNYKDTNHFTKYVRNYFKNGIKFPKIMLRSDHYFYSQKGLFAYFEMVNPDINGAPETLFKSENKNEYYPSNIDNYPNKKNFYLKFIKEQAEKHIEFENQLRFSNKNKIDLAKYINESLINEPIKTKPDKTKIVKKEPNKENKDIKKLKDIRKDLITLERHIYSSSPIDINFAENLLSDIQTNIKNLTNKHKASFSSKDREIIKIINKDIKTAKTAIDFERSKYSKTKLVKDEKFNTALKKNITWEVEVFSKLHSHIGREHENRSYFVKKDFEVDKSSNLSNILNEVIKKGIRRCEVKTQIKTRHFKCYLIRITYIDNAKPNEKKEIYNKSGIDFKNVKLDWEGLIDDKILIAKIDNDENAKKKKEVAKAEKPKQEEFIPKNKDNEAPIIEIAEAITVNDSSYEIEGKVIDKSKKLFVQIDGETIPVKNGVFKIKRFSPIDEQLKIVAIDQWGNKSKLKTVNITVDLEQTKLQKKLAQLNPSIIQSEPNKNRVALIIGIEKYEQTPEASFANLDAKYFYEYARKGFGISKDNIKLLIDEDANLIQSLSILNKWLPGKIIDGETELILFFAGHGLASSDGEELYLLSQDSDPDLLARTSLSRSELFNEIKALNPKSVTMFLDTCYSGITRDEKTLLASARPVRIVANDQDGLPDNFTVFSASKLNQISSGLTDANHGIFSYFLMKGLEGNADNNNDKIITNGELLAYMDQNVSQKASELGRQQNPSLAGNPDQILISFK
tara:strand:+ start:148 stop:2841 length:2694 start_codon:yes stop_codon:yes gene_type:complete